ncbi:MAG: replicative DNA helicase [Bacteroidetes bacterium]|nr:replicative DNA helicase [Bacteroidota bacterium]
MPELTDSQALSDGRITVRKPRAPQGNPLVYGKLPPQARELEEAVLGAMLIDRDAVSEIIDILKPESFYLDAHQTVYRAIMGLFERSEPVDILTVTEALRKSGELEMAGGAYFIAELSNKVSSAANVEHHARIVSQKHIQRELISISTTIIKDAYEDTTDVLELLDRSEQALFGVAEQNLRRSYDSMNTLIAKAIKEIDEVRQHEDSLTGIPSGFTALDRLTSGWQKSDLIVIAARPGMGKTAFTLALGRNAAVDFKKPVALFSLEMSSVQLVKRLISMETELTGDKIRKGNLAEHEWIQLTKMTGNLADAPIFIDDTPALNIFELRAKCRRLKQKHDVQLIVIDYLQLMSGTPNGKQGNREQEISNISRSLKSIAKELNVPVIALSQLSRAVETRGGVKKPMLSDLRESGAIEQDADMVIFLYRPEYYGLTQDDNGSQFPAGYAEVIIAKHRNGALENVPVRFIDKFAKFTDMDAAEFGGYRPGLSSSSKSGGASGSPGAGRFTPLNDHLTDSDSGVIKRSSKMDEFEEDYSDDIGDVPF